MRFDWLVKIFHRRMQIGTLAATYFIFEVSMGSVFFGDLPLTCSANWLLRVLFLRWQPNLLCAAVFSKAEVKGIVYYGY